MDMEWRFSGACRDEDPELHFPVGTTGPAVAAQIAEAKDVCDRCPVASQCLDWALKTRQQYGIWGGRDMEGRIILPLQVEPQRAAA